MPLKRITCKVCKTRFTPTRADRLYCSQACKQAAYRKSQDKTKALHNALTKTGFLTYLAYEARRSGTVEILRGHTTATFVELHEVWSYNNKANAYKTKEREYELSHIHPVNGVSGKIGCLHPSNLVVQRADFNRKHGTKYYGGGKAISSYGLKSQWVVSEDMPRPDVFKLIFKYLGDDLLTVFKKKCQPKRLAKDTLLDWFEKKVCITDQSIKLSDMSVEQLRKLQADFQSKQPFNLNFDPYTHHKVTMDELERFQKYRPELSGAVDLLNNNIAPCDEAEFWYKKGSDIEGFIAYRVQALSLLEPVLAGKDLRVADIAIECRNARERAIADSERLYAEQQARAAAAAKELEGKRAIERAIWQMDWIEECSQEYANITGNPSESYIHDLHYRIVEATMCPF